nr:MAG TPA: hypothetical protein [Caudoviricetes sp.]
MNNKCYRTFLIKSLPRIYYSGSSSLSSHLQLQRAQRWRLLRL